MVNNVKKDYFWNTLGTSLFSFNSLFLMIVVTRLNSLPDAGIFSFAYATAGIINYFALYSGRTYQISNTNKKFNRFFVCNDKIFNSLFCSMHLNNVYSYKWIFGK